LIQLLKVTTQAILHLQPLLVTPHHRAIT